KLRHDLVGQPAGQGWPCVAFLPGDRAVSAADRTLRLWDLHTGKAVSSAPQPRTVLRLAVSPGGRRLAVCGQGDEIVTVTDVKTRAVTHRLPGHTKGCSVAAFTPDGKRLLTGDLDGVLHVWDLTRSRPEIHNFRLSSAPLY